MQRIGYLQNVTFLYFLFGIVSILILISRGKPGLVKRKIVLGTMIFSLTGSAVSFISCKSASTKESWIGDVSDIWNYDGWVDENTYRTVSIGSNCKKALTETAKKNCTKKEAILNAQFKIIEKFKSMNYRGQGCYSGMSDFNVSGYAKSKEIEGVVKSGHAIAEKYDENFACSIVYEINAKGLKKLVDEADFK